MRFAVLILGLFVACLARPGKVGKRQLFREQVLPERGGKIPEEAFNFERINLNQLDRHGLYSDGRLLQSNRRSPKTSIKVQFGNSLAETSYVVRPTAGVVLQPLVERKTPVLVKRNHVKKKQELFKFGEEFSKYLDKLHETDI